MLEPDVSYFTILRIEHPVVVPKFAGVQFMTSIEMEFPSSKDEGMVFGACYEVLEKIKLVEGVTTLRKPNALHFTYDPDAVELEPTIVEKHDVVYDEKSIGVVVICAEGSLYPPSSTLQ